jgi:hypothetical protein
MSICSPHFYHKHHNPKSCQESRAISFQDNTITTDWIEAAHHTSTMDCMQQLITPFISWLH